MITYETEKYIILCPKFKVFSAKAVEEIKRLINQDAEKPYAIDMSNVYSLSGDFLSFLSSAESKVVLINPSVETLLLLNLTNSDKLVKLFVNNIDLDEDRREMRNRKFSVL